MRPGAISRIRVGKLIVNGYATQNITQEMLNLWSEDLTYVTYYSYGFTPQGELIPLNDANLIQYAIESDVAPLMALTPYNEKGEYSYELTRIILSDPNVRDRLINNVVQNIIDKKYFGMVFNFGYLAPQDRDQFVVTVSKTTARLNAMGDLVIVSITPGLYDAGIDYSSLGRAANFIELKTFEPSPGLSAPAPLSSREAIYNFLAFNRVLNSRNVLLGISNYGYDWALPFPDNQSLSQFVSNEEAIRRAEEMGIEILYGERSRAPYYYYTDASGIQHIVWFENEESMKAKMEIVDEFALGGISIWTIMDPFPTGMRIVRENATILKIPVKRDS